MGRFVEYNPNLETKWHQFRLKYSEPAQSEQGLVTLRENIFEFLNSDAIHGRWTVKRRLLWNDVYWDDDYMYTWNCLVLYFINPEDLMIAKLTL